MKRTLRLCAFVLSSALVATSARAQTITLPTRLDTLAAQGTAPLRASPYQVRAGVSLALSAGALGLAALLEGAVRPALSSSMTCVRDATGSCSGTRLLAIDRAALGQTSHAWDVVSDVGQIFLPVAGALTLGFDAFVLSTTRALGLSAATDNLLVGLEAVALATSATTVLKFAVRRPRPRQYSAAPKVGVDGDLSFPSGHTTLAAAVAVATAATLTLSHPQPSVRTAAWLTAAAATGTMATARVLAGKHFPTDVLAGALVGGITGLVVPLCHRLPVRVAPALGRAGYVGLTLEGALGVSPR